MQNALLNSVLSFFSNNLWYFKWLTQIVDSLIILEGIFKNAENDDFLWNQNMLLSSVNYKVKFLYEVLYAD